jgi:TonB family protein
MKYNQPSGSDKLPIDEYHPIETPGEEEPKKRGSNIVLFFLTLFLIIVLASLVTLIFKPELFAKLTTFKLAKKSESSTPAEVQQENIPPPGTQKSISSPLSNEERIVALEKELLDVRKRNENLTSQIRGQREEISRLNSELNKAQQDKNNAENENKKLRDELEQNKTYYESQIKQMSDGWEQNKKQLQSELKQTADELEQTKRKLQTQGDLYRRQSEKQTAAVEEILRDAKRAQQRADQAEEAQRKSEEEIKRLKGQLAEQEKKAKEVKEGDLVTLTADVQEPSIIKSSNPRYPIWARRRGVKGEVNLRVLISETGQVLDAEVMSCTQPGYGLEDAALDAVKKWEFAPAIKDGKRVRVWMNYTIHFKP